MREDMHQVVFGNRRVGNTPLKPGRSPRDPDMQASREGMRRPYVVNFGIRCKETRFNYAPVHRYLDSQLGKDWDTVYSDICRIFDARKPANRHVLEHLRGRVQIRDLEVVDGAVMEMSRYAGWYPVSGWFVHPVSRTLQKSAASGYRKQLREREAADKAKALAQVIAVSKTHSLMQQEGTWFMVEYAPVTAPHRFMTQRYMLDPVTHKWAEMLIEAIDRETICIDMLTGDEFTPEFMKNNPERTYYAKAKHQASHRDMRRHNVL